MTEAIILVGCVITAAIMITPHTNDYQNDLRNIEYQLSRIADALNQRTNKAIDYEDR